MGKKPRTKMPREQRAKQFAPFQAVGGLEEALRKAEEEHRMEVENGAVERFTAGDAEAEEYE